MSSILSSEGDDYSRYSAFDDTNGSTTICDSTTFVVQSKTATSSISLADVKFDTQHVERREHQQREYSRDEFLYALSSPSSIGAMAWIVSSFFAVIYGSSVIVYLNFCIPLLVGPYVIREQMPAQLLPCK
jgi:lipopolysaccharide export LptBFGC system permease protein LptF